MDLFSRSEMTILRTGVQRSHAKPGLHKPWFYTLYFIRAVTNAPTSESYTQTTRSRPSFLALYSASSALLTQLSGDSPI